MTKKKEEFEQFIYTLNYENIIQKSIYRFGAI